MIYFISDLHLHASRPAATEAFVGFLKTLVPDNTLWILGDLFEYWAGDDDIEGNAFHTRVADALLELTQTGVKVMLLVGNRDFLLGKQFAERTGVRLVDEPRCIALGHTSVMLMHGDSLCTDDEPYQQFRRMVRNPGWQLQFLAQPLAVRHKIAEDMRAKSEISKQGKTMEIMDVNAEAVARSFRETGALWLIHGHTHRPAMHEHAVDGIPRTRYVLPDWHEQACGLWWNGKILERFDKA